MTSDPSSNKEVQKNQLNSTYIIKRPKVSDVTRTKPTVRFNMERPEVLNTLKEKHSYSTRTFTAKKMTNHSGNNIQRSVSKGREKGQGKGHFNNGHNSQPFDSNLCQNSKQAHQHFVNAPSNYHILPQTIFPHPSYTYNLESNQNGANVQPCYIFLQPLYCDDYMARGNLNYNLSSKKFQHQHYQTGANQFNTNRMPDVFMYPNSMKRVYYEYIA